MINNFYLIFGSVEIRGKFVDNFYVSCKQKCNAMPNNAKDLVGLKQQKRNIVSPLE